PDPVLPVRGISVPAAVREHLDQFIAFTADGLARNRVNTILLRIDFKHAYESHPELREENPLTREDVKRIVAAARKAGIRIIPQINLLGPQSSASSLGKLLEAYPQVDETPHI